ncbi:MAG: hypoxanthine phosphoribosyltransferase [Bacteroidaceae bacterium]|nr:hypoxanthine phosphoribosyltransferase [Candidatus Minthousia equi]MCQ2246510.1 hypoxanthine phosphoribosyltransferase [Bacteroidaceae bacterium]MDO4956967.1 hypoxanthine phosphoribosyltransferase [Bacteroidales bacterium]
MDTITVNNKEFRLSIPESEILKQVDRVAQEITNDLDGKNPLFLCVLNGSFMFASDLLKRVNIPAEISFVKMSSYQGTVTTGKVRRLLGVDRDLTGRTVVIVEDIVESGITMVQLLEDLRMQNPAEIKICTLLSKPNKRQVEVKVDYVAMEIPDEFIVGYGLDYDGFGRNLPDIYTIV